MAVSNTDHRFFISYRVGNKVQTKVITAESRNEALKKLNEETKFKVKGIKSIRQLDDVATI